LSYTAGFPQEIKLLYSKRRLIPHSPDYRRGCAAALAALT